jgi:hypothetical protein
MQDIFLIFFSLAKSLSISWFFYNESKTFKREGGFMLRGQKGVHGSSLSKRIRRKPDDRVFHCERDRGEEASRRGLPDSLPSLPSVTILHSLRQPPEELVLLAGPPPRAERTIFSVPFIEQGREVLPDPFPVAPCPGRHAEQPQRGAVHFRDRLFGSCVVSARIPPEMRTLSAHVVRTGAYPDPFRTRLCYHGPEVVHKTGIIPLPVKEMEADEMMSP